VTLDGVMAQWRKLQLLQLLLLAARLTAELDGGGVEERPLDAGAPLRRALAVIGHRPAHLLPVQAQCKPTKLELTCHPHAGLVASDGSEQTLRACNPRTCHTDALVIPNGRTSPQGFVYVGWEVRIECNAGYELDADSGGSAAPKCRDDCGFEAPASCAPVKCPVAGIAPNGVVLRGEQPASSNHAYISFDEYVRVTCNHGYMASDSAHVYNEPCKLSYIRECLADGSLSNSNLECVPLTCPPPPDQLEDGIVAGSWISPRAMGYKERSKLTCFGCRIVQAIPGSEDVAEYGERECSWTCQLTPARSMCVDKPCFSEPKPGTQWKNGLKPLTCGSTGTLQCISSGTVLENNADPLSCISEKTYTCGRPGYETEQFALLDSILKPCVLATCPLSRLIVANAVPVTNHQASPTPVGGKYGQYFTVACNAGYRARASSARGPVLPASSKTLDVRCGVSSRGQSGYDPCAW
jgi:hypothetical protein